MDTIVPTAQYNTDENARPATPPAPWQRYDHPNGDHYYYHPIWRLITPENICEPQTLNYIVTDINDLQVTIEASDLPEDLELVIKDPGEGASTVQAWSRSAGTGYGWSQWSDDDRFIPKNLWSWTLLAEYPCHQPTLPPGVEAHFVQALAQAKNFADNNMVFGLKAPELERVEALYNTLKADQEKGVDVASDLGWLIGVTMPLDDPDKVVDLETLEEMLEMLNKKHA